MELLKGPLIEPPAVWKMRVTLARSAALRTARLRGGLGRSEGRRGTVTKAHGIQCTAERKFPAKGEKTYEQERQRH